jgi:hypothetical protein
MEFFQKAKDVANYKKNDFIVDFRNVKSKNGLCELLIINRFLTQKIK